jgi:galactoside O-acetyltransferase/dTDP-4-amino-4,6-dideoxygalactose transaminase
MAYLLESQLAALGFKSLGKNIKISDKAAIYNPELIEIGDRSRIDDFCVLSGRITIGKNVHIAPLCLVAGGDKGITFMDFSGLAYHVQVFTQSDDYSGSTLTNPTVSIDFKSEIKKEVSIGKHVIVGAGSIIFPGVTIAEGCSIGALTLVNKSTEEWGVYLGNPARRIKNRKKDLLQLETQYMQSINEV